MSRDVQLQADVGALGLKGLGAFTTLLATLSADNVAPLALIQLEKLGAVFPTSGPCAENTKSLLRRCSDVRVANLALAIGWRKNDTASLMADSAGGQAISLLCLCLTTMFKHDEAGLMLSKLSAAMLSHDSNLASASQLKDVALLLSGKLGSLGFGNIIAQEFMKIQDALSAMRPDIEGCVQLLHPIPTDSALELLQLISKSLLEDQRLCRISGCRSMGLLMGLLQVLFHRDLSIFVDGTILQAASRPKIILDIKLSTDLPMTTFALEEQRNPSQGNILTIGFHQLYPRNPPTMKCQYKWNGWLADELALKFATLNLTLPQAIVDACHQLALLVAPKYQIHADYDICIRKEFEDDEDDEDGNSTRQYSCPAPLVSLLGPRSNARLQSCCDLVLGKRQDLRHVQLEEAFEYLQAWISAILSKRTCDCEKGHRCEGDYYFAWQHLVNYQGSERKHYNCDYFQVWKAVAFTINAAIVCTFINPGRNAVIQPELGKSFQTFASITAEILGAKSKRSLKLSDLWSCVEALGMGGSVDNDYYSIARSSSYCTIYPTALQDISTPPQQAATFDCVEGRLLFQDRYHHRLRSDYDESKPELNTKLRPKDRIVPSSIEKQDGEPLITIEEGFEELILHCSIVFDGVRVALSIGTALSSYLSMTWTNSCPHTSATPLENYTRIFLETSVAQPRPIEHRIGIVMTRWNTMAQFLACHEATCLKVLVRDCCLPCATNGVSRLDPIMFIMG